MAKYKGKNLSLFGWVSGFLFIVWRTTQFVVRQIIERRRKKPDRK